jgi:serine-type D-Ala-D-Ala carboxypeptidase/endopeptidase
MRRATVLAAASACALAMGCHGEESAASGASAFPSDSDLLNLIRSRVEDGRAAGIVLGVMEADGTTRVVSAGDAGEGARPLGRDSVFEIGSITKTFTATILADMARQGEVDLDAPAQTYAPDGFVLPARNGEEITLAQLAEHRSGLPRLPANLVPADPANPYADYTPEQLQSFLASYELPRDPGAEFEYSNLGVGLLGLILAHHAGQTYEALVHERVLDPLEMTMTGVTLTLAMRPALAQGHDTTGGAASSWDTATLTAASGLRSTVTDMLAYLDANVGPPQSNLERAMRDAQRPRAAAGAPSVQIGLGWLIRTTPSGRTIVWHNGITGGYGAVVGFDPARQVGVVLLVNQAGAHDDILFHLLDPAIQLAPAPIERTEVELTRAQMERFTGVYDFDHIQDFAITITLENGGLMIQATGQPKVPVFPESETQVFARIVDAQISLVLDDTGAVTGLVLHQSGMDRPASKVE